MAMPESSRPVRLSVAMVVRDVADPLRWTLASIRGIADEIVVVDTGSSDSTRSVAAEFGACVVDFAWSDSFSEARNAGLGKVAGDWILWLDAGEALSDEDTCRLKQFLARDADPRCAYMLLVRVPATDSQASDEQIGRVRVIPRFPELAYAGRVRETCERSMAAAGIRVAGVPFVIRRSAREHDSRLKKGRAQRNIRLAELEHREQGPSARLWNCLGDALHTLGEFRQAADCFRQSLALASRGTPDMLEATYGLLTSLDPEQCKDEQLRLCVEALEVFPLDAQLLCALAAYLHARGQRELARDSYTTAYRFGQIQPEVWHLRDIRDIAAVCASASLQLEQRSAEATQFLEEAVRDCDSARLRRRLIDLYVDAGDRESALAQVAGLPKDTPHLEALRSAVRGACYAAQQNWIAAKAYLNAAYGHGCRDAFCHKWLATTLLACGEAEAARPILERWASLDPRNPEPAKLLAMPAPSAESPGSADSRRIRIDAGLPQGPLTMPANAPSISAKPT
jgi:tetratricopeptide (TPR) repeat protein